MENIPSFIEFFHMAGGCLGYLPSTEINDLFAFFVGLVGFGVMGNG